MNDYTKSLTWEIVATDRDLSRSLLSELSLHPLVAALLAARGITTPAAAQGFMDPRFYRPTPADELPDLPQAIELLQMIISQQLPVLVWGDFDVDGQTATALLVSVLGALRVPVTFYIPNRLEESHGIQPDILRQQIELLSPALLLTCDTGVAAHEAVDYAKRRGIAVIITDHHDLPPALPLADAIINPKRLPPDHPLATLPGVGVAYKLCESLLSHLDQPQISAELTDLAALGIVADVAALRGDTRYLLQAGLTQLRRDQRPGLSALYRLAQLEPQHLTETHIAFQIAPRLNAAGRLDDARLVVELLTTTDEEQAQTLALRLDGLNRQRQLYERQILAAAQSQIEQDPSLLDWHALVLHHPNWHPGVLGVVANRLASLYQRPVILLASSGEVARGSARSAGGYDIHAAIAAQADLLLSFGGHPGAAGLALPVENIPAFRRRLSDTLAAMPAAGDRASLVVDAVVRLDEVTLDLARALEQLAPFGEGNPRPILACERLTLVNTTFLGREQEHRRLSVVDELGNRRDVLWWNSASASLPTGVFDLAFQVEVSHYRDQPELQLTLVGFRPSPTETISVAAPARQVIDRRLASQPLLELTALRKVYPDAVIWAEGHRRSEAPGVPLSALHPAQTLIVYTAPHSPTALSQALQQVSPARVILIGTDPPLTKTDTILRRLLELIKYVMARQGGLTALRELAEAVAQPERVIRLALRYAQSANVLRWDEGQDGVVNISRPPAGTLATDGDPALWTAFQAQVAETSAYRTFFRRATLAQLFPEETYDVLPDSGPDHAR